MADKDLAFLYECSNDELDALVEIIKSRFTEMLTVAERYKKYAPNHKKYVADIEQELIDFGTSGGGLKNLILGNTPYREIVRDVCKELGAAAYQNASTSTLEDALLETVLSKMWDDLPRDERRTLAKELGRQAQMIFESEGFSYDSLRESFRTKRRASYYLSALLADSVARKYSAGNSKIAKGLGQTLAIGLVSAPLAVIFAAYKVAGPAFQVTIPAAIYIAALRRMKEYDSFAQMRDQAQYGEPMIDEYDLDDDDELDEEEAVKQRKEIEDLFESR